MTKKHQKNEQNPPRDVIHAEHNKNLALEKSSLINKTKTVKKTYAQALSGSGQSHDHNSEDVPIARADSIDKKLEQIIKHLSNLDKRMTKLEHRAKGESLKKND